MVSLHSQQLLTAQQTASEQQALPGFISHNMGPTFLRSERDKRGTEKKKLKFKH